MITGTTRIYGIYGWPVEHTFSPAMHNAAFRALDKDARYVPFAVAPEMLEEAVLAIRALGLCGLNITVPHKERVIPFLDGLSEEASLIGAVNTIQVKDGKLIGHNTDGRGFIRSLREDAGFKPRGKSVVLIGSGGAARAVGFSLALAKTSSIACFDIDAAKAAALCREIAQKTGVRTSPLVPADVPSAAMNAACLINATPLGLKKGDPLPLAKSLILKHHLVCDLVYNPPETPLLKAAKARGARRLSGIGMLLYQGVIAFELWTGSKAPIAVMKRALAGQMRAR